MIKTYFHQGDFGDILAHLPLIRTQGRGRLVLYPGKATGRRMTPERAASLGALLERQPYIESVEWRARADDNQGFNLDGWRKHGRKGLNLTDKVFNWLGLPFPDRNEPWLFVEPNPIAKIVFARAPRWNNPRFPWKKVWEKYHEDAVFVGHPDEHALFEKVAGEVDYLPTVNMLELARVIAGCELFCGSQSSPFWIAEALKKRLILEVCPRYNNCRFEREGALHVLDKTVFLPEL